MIYQSRYILKQCRKFRNLEFNCNSHLHCLYDVHATSSTVPIEKYEDEAEQLLGTTCGHRLSCAHTVRLPDDRSRHAHSANQCHQDRQFPVEKRPRPGRSVYSDIAHHLVYNRAVTRDAITLTNTVQIHCAIWRFCFSIRSSKSFSRLFILCLLWA